MKTLIRADALLANTIRWLLEDDAFETIFDMCSWVGLTEYWFELKNHGGSRFYPSLAVEARDEVLSFTGLHDHSTAEHLEAYFEELELWLENWVVESGWPNPNRVYFSTYYYNLENCIWTILASDQPKATQMTMEDPSWQSH